MSPLTQEWIEKAEGDFRTAVRELAATDRPNYDAGCFHAQQCAEKYLKARLQERVIEFPKTHQLGYLLDLLLNAEPDWASLRDNLLRVDRCAVDFRYPGAFADQPNASAALEDCKIIRAAFRRSFGLA